MTTSQPVTETPWYQAQLAEASFGQTLRAFRQADGCTLKQWGQQLGLSPQALSRLERGLDKPSLKKAKAMGEALGYGDVFALQLLRDVIQEAELNIQIQLAS